jgi:hypothetical protein
MMANCPVCKCQANIETETQHGARSGIDCPACGSFNIRVELAAKRIEEAARYFPREQMGLSTQCGFGTVWAGNPIPESVQEAKLRLVAEIAHRAWR